MKHFTVEELVNAVNGEYYGDPNALSRQITYVTSDSRCAKQGALFVAFEGARADGHDFMASCLQNGAVCCLSQRVPTIDEQPCVVVDSTLHAIGALAAWHRTRFAIPVVGITGSVGKTTPKEMIASALSAGRNTHKTEKIFNNELGVPQTLLRLDDAHEVSVVEMGISDFGEMHRLTNMVRPTIAVMTAISDCHLENLGDRPGVLRAKAEIFESMTEDDLAILNGDDALLHDFYPPTRRLTYGLNPDNDFTAKDIQNYGLDGVSCMICHHDQAFDVQIPAFGVHTVYAALAAAAVGWSLGLSDDVIAKGIAEYHTVGDRAKVIHQNGITIISDCYNANPTSVSAALESLRMLPERRVCILGDMLELGENALALHARIGQKAAMSGVGLILTCGELSQATFEGARSAGGNAMWFQDKQEMIRALPGLIRRGDSILVKASHSIAFEEVTESLLKLWA